MDFFSILQETYIVAESNASLTVRFIGLLYVRISMRVGSENLWYIFFETANFTFYRNGSEQRVRDFAVLNRNRGPDFVIEPHLKFSS